ncbi:sigma-54-dependent transcriptional regulator family protein [Acinetobacter larvae]|uniref:Transcriptional regulator n=1 Tax=Acinetobacter larvae TaxID=1789224 RepID=A0A1B2M0M4_9GAMM|nr:transcriptional regulator [Acinetobacter larvae]AOA58742.1 transcriptional regulator [Acinetobacter larvae]
MLSQQILLEKRQQIEKMWEKNTFRFDHDDPHQQSIVSSWQRSQRAAVCKERYAAPLQDKVLARSSTLHNALERCATALQDIAAQSDMVVAVGDSGSTIVWSAASGRMQQAAEQVHFVAGGQWGEEAVGTNALALSLKTEQSSCVFSNEHYMSSVHDWVCYAAPIIDPYSRQLLGVIDLSTTWQHHNSLGLLAVERCASMIQSALYQAQQQHLYIRAFGIPQILMNGKLLVLTPRQIEILTILSLCPQGMSLDQLHQALYGERKVSMGTLKAEMSQLKDILSGQLASRPYRIMAKVDADFLQTEQDLDAGYIQSALKRCRGVFLSKTESPFLCTWRDCLESRLSKAIFDSHEPDSLLRHLAYSPEAVDALERLLELIPVEHPAHQQLLQFKNL